MTGHGIRSVIPADMHCAARAARAMHGGSALGLSVTLLRSAHLCVSAVCVAQQQQCVWLLRAPYPLRFSLK